MKKTTSSMAFDGMENGNSGGYSKKYQTNASGKTARENYGRGPTKAGRTGDDTGVSTAKSKVTGHAAVPKCSMSINVGRGPTKGCC